jgi:hypothetical protein
MRYNMVFALAFLLFSGTQAQTLIRSDTVSLGGMTDQIFCVFEDSAGDILLGGENKPKLDDPGFTVSAAVSKRSAFTTVTNSTSNVVSGFRQTTYQPFDNTLVQYSYPAAGTDGKSFLTKVDSNGNIVWQKEVDGSGAYYLGTYRQYILFGKAGVNATCSIVNPDGSLEKSFPIAGYTPGNLSLIARGDTLYVFANNLVAKFQLPDGKLIWKTPAYPGNIEMSGAVDKDGNAYLAAWQNVNDTTLPYGVTTVYGMTKYNAADGQVIWDKQWTYYARNLWEANMINAVNAVTVSPNSERVALLGVIADLSRRNQSPYSDWWNQIQANYVAVLDTKTGDVVSDTLWNFPALSGVSPEASQIEDGYFRKNGELVILGDGEYRFTGNTPRRMINFVQVWKIDGTTGVKRENPSIPSGFSLSQNYPNPFNPDTKIQYSLKKSSEISLDIYDVLGRKVKTLVNGHMPAGKYEADFDASKLPSGVYFYRLQADRKVETKKMVVNK